MHATRLFAVPLLLTCLAGCGAAPEVDGDQALAAPEEAAVGERASELVQRCVTAPRTAQGAALFVCPAPGALLASLCPAPQFSGSIQLGYTCDSIVGSAEAVSYVLTYQCTRPQPCR